jgi:dolichol-phosphate mannosyltransferase
MQNFYGNEKIKLLSRPSKLGLGTAYIEGAQLSTADFIFIMDADFSHHVSLYKFNSITISQSIS